MYRIIQKLYLGGLPPGLNMTVKAIKPSVPDDKMWKADFWRVDVGGFRADNIRSHDTLSEPYSIKGTSTADGLIGQVMLDTAKPSFSFGTGGKVDITIRIQGTTNVNGISHNVDQKGYISVSASDWNGIARPDFSHISYCWGDTPPIVLSISVPPTIAEMPADAYFVFGLSADGKQIGMNTTLHKEIVNKVMAEAMEGIFFANEKLAGWVIGKVV